MARETVTIRTDDGSCPTHVFRPSKPTGASAVVLFMDGIGMRPAIVEMGEHLCSMGYFVIAPDVFYRVGPYTAPEPKALFTNPEVRSAWFGKISANAQPAMVMRDTKAYLAYLASQGATKIGTTGYCMGGVLSMQAAGHYPDRIVAAAAFHPGSLASDKPESPHLLAPQIKARLLVAAATEDQSFPEEQKERWVKALDDAHVSHTFETYPAKHGWVPRDTPVHDAAQTERHWRALDALFQAAL